jgi:hypothetical protein
MPDFSEFADQLKTEIIDLAESRLDDLKEEALEDGRQFVNEAEDDLKEWTELLEEGELTKSGFESLVKGKKELAKMESLKQAGLAAVEAQKFRDALFDRIVGTAGEVFL